MDISETAVASKVNNIDIDVVGVVPSNGDDLDRFPVATWRLQERLRLGWTGPICDECDCEWDANGEHLRCTKCGLDCS